PTFNFASVPRVQGRDPLWADPLLAEASARPDGLLGDASHGRRELLGTGLLDAKPEQVIRISGPTWLPLLAAIALAVLLACFIAKAYWFALALVVPLLALLWRWAWTTGHPGAPAMLDAAPGMTLPSQYAARNAPGWWALVISLLVDGSLFASLVFSYFYLWLGTEAWPPAGLGMSTLAVAAAALALLVACAGATHLAVRALRHDNRPAATLCWL